MAEIKSTMDLVMERMAKMTANAKPVTSDEDTTKEGMRLAAEYLNHNLGDLAATLAEQPAEKQKALYTGAVRTLLRNVLLPRDEALAESGRLALAAIMAIAGNLGVSSISKICSELEQILQQYNQHLDKVTQQLEDSLKAQLEQQYGGRGMDTSRIRANMHPKYNEEMSQMQLELNGQYNQAIQQRKDLLLQQLGLA
ncbi:MAG: hypothetical protein ACK5PS_04025 [Desulfopila sp.]